MCARLELNDSVLQLGQALAVWLEERHSAWLIWEGFARNESLGAGSRWARNSWTFLRGGSQNARIERAA